MNIGFVEMDGHIIISNTELWANLLVMFEEINKGSVGTGSNNRVHKWYKVKKRFCADKIPVSHLEANVARYIKALSACGIYTGGCCDGNHPNCNVLHIEFDGPVYSDIHQYLWKYLLADKFKLKWNSKYTDVFLDDDKYLQYEILNDAASFIYENRVFIRNIRMQAADWMSDRMLKDKSDKELKQRFIQEFETILRMQSIFASN